MSLDFTNVTSVTIPEGDVTQIAIDGSIVWKRQPPAGYWEVTRSDGIAPTAGTMWVVRLSDGATGYYAFATSAFTAVSFAVGDVVGHDDIMFSVNVDIQAEHMSQYVYLNGGTYKCVNWGDGTVSAVASGAFAVNHTYATAGTYTVKTYAVDPTRLFFYSAPDYMTNCVFSINNRLPWTTLYGGGMFTAAKKIREIPADLFENCGTARSFGWCFYGCTSLQEIPSTLFDKCISVTSFSECFRYCSAVKGQLPDLWNTHPTATTHSLCFTGCTQAANYADAQQAGWA